jgi:hypothetical protein
MMHLLDFARLVRLPNVFTAMADIGLAALATDLPLPERLIPFACVLLATVALYWSGMVFNDYFDIEQDKRERPHRPLASGRIPTGTAFRLAALLMAIGLLFAALADWTGGSANWRALPVAIALCVAILLYDGWLKSTRAGPAVMGSCRFLNVLLGLSVAPEPIAAWGVALALVLGVYITGVTWFARTEAHVSNQSMLIVGAAFMLTGLIIALTVPPLAQRVGLAPHTAVAFPYLLTAFGCYVGSAVIRAIRQPVPRRVQAAVKRALLGLIVLDAVLATAMAGLAGLVLLVLMLPAYFLGRWVYST